MDLLTKFTMVLIPQYVLVQIIMLYILNLYYVICKLYKTETIKVNVVLISSAISRTFFESVDFATVTI